VAAWWLEKKRSAVFYLKDRDINRQDRQRRYRIPGYFKRMFPSQFGIYLDKVFSTFRMAGDSLLTIITLGRRVLSVQYGFPALELPQDEMGSET
jgi:hypothetical protein